jgi:hypothetical protein
MHEAFQLKLIAVLFGKQFISTFMMRVEMGIVQDDFQPCIQRASYKLRLPAADSTLYSSPKLASNSILVRADSQNLSAQVEVGQLASCPRGFAGNGKATEEI